MVMYQLFVHGLKHLKVGRDFVKYGVVGYISVKILINQKKGVPL